MPIPRLAPTLAALAIVGVVTAADAQIATPALPVCGSEVAAPVTLVANNAAGTHLYDFQLFSDLGLTILVAEGQDLAQEPGDLTGWPIPVTLNTAGTYYWRVRAGAGPFSPTCSFRLDVNDPPGMVQLLSPMGQVPELRPTLRVQNTTDPDDTLLRYHFEVYSDPALSIRVADSGAGGVPAGGGDVTAWQLDVDLLEDRFYYWRARATDPQGLAGPWSGAGQLFVNVTNTPPGEPVVLAPLPGEVVPTLRPTLRLVAAADQDFDPLVYDWVVARDPAFANIVASGSNHPPDGPLVTIALSADLVENQRYCWGARADDGQASSAYTTTCFLVSVTNDPPSIPRPDSPAGTTTTRTPVFAWMAAIDPEDDEVLYEVEVRGADGALIGAVGGIRGTVTALASELTDGLDYTWQVRAIDRQGAVGAWSPRKTFVVQAVDDPQVATSGAGCRVGGGPAPAMGLLVLALVGWRARRRR